MDGILNLYEDGERFYHEKKRLETFLKTFTPLQYDFFVNRLREEVYIQFLSVLNPLFLERDYVRVIPCVKQAYENREHICFLQGKTSPALLFFPHCNGEICNGDLLSVLSEHARRPVQSGMRVPLLDSRLFLEIGPVIYPDRQIYRHKADGADDLIGSTCIELIYTEKDREHAIARVGVFFGQDRVLVSCVQNRKAGRAGYSLRSSFPEIENFFEIPLFFLSKTLCSHENKKIWFFRDATHNCRIYTMKNRWFRGIYDELGLVHGMERVDALFWQAEVTTLYEHYRHMERFFPKNLIQPFTDL